MASPAKLSVECSSSDIGETDVVATSLSPGVTSSFIPSTPKIQGTLIETDDLSPILTTVNLDRAQGWRESSIQVPVKSPCCRGQTSPITISVQINNSFDKTNIDDNKDAILTSNVDSQAKNGNGKSCVHPSHCQGKQSTLRLAVKYILLQLTLIFNCFIFLSVWQERNYQNINQPGPSFTSQVLPNWPCPPRADENMQINSKRRHKKKEFLNPTSYKPPDIEPQDNGTPQKSSSFEKQLIRTKMSDPTSVQPGYPRYLKIKMVGVSLKNESESSDSILSNADDLSGMSNHSVNKVFCGESNMAYAAFVDNCGSSKRRQANPVVISDSSMQLKFKDIWRIKPVKVQPVVISQSLHCKEDVCKQQQTKDLIKSSMTQDFTSLSMQGENGCRPAMKSMKGGGLVSVDKALGILAQPLNSVIKSSTITTSMCLAIISCFVSMFQLLIHLKEKGFLSLVKQTLCNTWNGLFAPFQRTGVKIVSVLLPRGVCGKLGLIMNCLMYCQGFEEVQGAESRDSGVANSGSIVYLSAEELHNLKLRLQRRAMLDKEFETEPIPKEQIKSNLAFPRLQLLISDPDNQSQSQHHVLPVHGNDSEIVTGATNIGTFSSQRSEIEDKWDDFDKDDSLVCSARTLENPITNEQGHEDDSMKVIPTDAESHNRCGGGNENSIQSTDDPSDPSKDYLATAKDSSTLTNKGSGGPDLFSGSQDSTTTRGPSYTADPIPDQTILPSDIQPRSLDTETTKGNSDLGAIDDENDNNLNGEVLAAETESDAERPAASLSAGVEFEDSVEIDANADVDAPNIPDLAVLVDPDPEDIVHGFYDGLLAAETENNVAADVFASVEFEDDVDVPNIPDLAGLVDPDPGDTDHGFHDGLPVYQNNATLQHLLQAVKEVADKYDRLFPGAPDIPDERLLDVQCHRHKRKYVWPHSRVVQNGHINDLMNYLLGIVSALNQTGVFLQHFQLHCGPVVRVLSDSRKLCVDQTGEIPYIEEQVDLTQFILRRRAYENYIAHQEDNPDNLKVYGVTKTIENGQQYVNIIYQCREKVEYITVFVMYKPHGFPADGQSFRVHKGQTVRSVLSLSPVQEMVANLKQTYPALRSDHYVRLILHGCRARPSPSWRLNNTCILELIPIQNMGRCPLG